MVRKSHYFEIAALGVFAVILAAGAPGWGWLKSALAGFAVASLGYSAAVALALQRARAGDLPLLAARHDQRAAIILVSGLALDFSALLLVIRLLTSRSMDAVEIGLAAASIFAAWILLNLLFAVHYAHTCFVSAPQSQPMLNFPGGQPGEFSDFLYFSFVIGMTFQVSDVTIADSGMRRLVLAHAILAFLFNVFVLALAVNALGSIM